MTGGEEGSVPGSETPQRSPARGRACAAGICFALVACGLLVWARLSPPQPAPLREPELWLASALSNQAAAPYSELWPHLVVERGGPPRSIVHLGAGERGGSPLEESFQRSYFRVVPPLAPPAGFGGPSGRSLYPGPLPADRPQLTLVGVWTLGAGPEPSAQFDVLAYSESAAPKGARWVFGPPRARNLHAGALRGRLAAGEVFLPLR